jgi:hypothetical protein
MRPPPAFLTQLDSSRRFVPRFSGKRKLMNSQRLDSFRKSLIAVAVLGISAPVTSDAALVVALVLDPPTTAGSSPDVTSTRSGSGTWHLFALDDVPGDYGIGNYNIIVAGAGSVNHRSPVTNIQDTNGDAQSAGFNLLRTPTNANPIQASQNLPGLTPFLIHGFGQTAGSFTAQAAAIQPGSTVIGPTTSAAWGNYNTIAPLNGKNWLFIAEGTYNPSSPPNITQATFDLYTSPTTFQQRGPTSAAILITPEPSSVCLLTLAIIGASVFARWGRMNPTVV